MEQDDSSTYKFGPQGVQPEAIAGVDTALWDIWDKACRSPHLHPAGGGLSLQGDGVRLHRRRASLSHDEMVLFVPHQTQSTIGTAASLHVCDSTQTCTRPQEYTGQRPQMDAIFEQPLEFKDGCITLPLRPGLELEVIPSKLGELAL